MTSRGAVRYVLFGGSDGTICPEIGLFWASDIKPEVALMRMLLCAFLSFVVLGCAAPPPKYDFNPVATINGNYDDVWTAVVEYFAVGSLPIQTIEKASGLVVTGWMRAGESYVGEDKTFCDCGKKSALATYMWTRGKFNIFIKNLSDDTVDMRVTCTFQQNRGTYGGIVDCNSTGYLEEQLHAYVQAKVSGQTPPQIPSFQPGESE